MKILSRLTLVSLALFQASSHAAANDVTPNYDVGVYYFPGWLDDQRGAPAAKPWDRIKAYPEREPLLGWYHEGSVEVAEQHIEWMSSHGIDYVVFDWYWDGKPMLDHAADAFMKASNNRKMRFSLLWSTTMVPKMDIARFPPTTTIAAFPAPSIPWLCHRTAMVNWTGHINKTGTGY